MSPARRLFLPLLIVAVAAPLRAVDRQLIASLLEKAYKDQSMVLRISTSGGTIRYSADGRLLKGNQSGPWTLDADIHCTGIKLKRNNLVIKGERLYFLYDNKLQILRPYFGPAVAVEIAIGHGSPSLSALQQAIGRVFVTSGENPVLLVPDYWKDYLLHPTRRATAPPPGQMSGIPLSSMQRLTGETKESALPLYSVYEANPPADPGKEHKVGPPRPIYKPEPPFTPEARMAHIEGTVILSVEIDATGRVTKDSIVRPLGMGLDDNAAQTIQKWKFEPGTRDGKPVAVRVLVEVSFRFH